ncbi:YjbF family lipoprotein [Octadecabacter sp. 1_MG-2023]|uniref:YjbF family lipoprotein n=1 Tax=unclassified Octadecabacter TaxID=196158 RepID=UPI001C088B5E|nr:MULTISPECIES: YjbF family lipoprotein [unclassified Octadecabacter]MBU2992167.1 YjbF family lipoprotein [Octadecabacter sp. B2R22]MDO6735077.1 YjbF family lipoprotein [Octadecabacter sp. 1_MG-2023]
MKTSWISALSAAALLAISSCGPLNTKNATAGVVRGIVQSGMPGDSTAAAVVEAPPALTRAYIDAQDTNLLRVSIIDREATGLIFAVGRNGEKVTWNSPDGLSFVLEGGFLVGTRGLGDDVMGSDVSGARSALRSGGSYLRTIDFLNGLSQIERSVYQCEMEETRTDELTIVEKTYATTILEETCTGENHSFKNTYWRGVDGIVWQSRQWISAGVGYLGYQRL